MRARHCLTGPSTHARGARVPGLTNRRGAAAIIVAVCIVPLVGVLGLAVDVGMYYRARRNAQTAADAAALAYAHERYRGNGTATADAALVSEATANGYTNGANHAAVVRAATTWGASPNAIRVTVTDTVPSLFAGIFGLTKAAVVASGVATYDVAVSSACVYVTEPTEPSALDVSGNGGVNAIGCGIVVNSTSSSAMTVSGSADLIAASIGVAGNYTTQGQGYSMPTMPRTGIPRAVSPLASVSMPAIPAGCTSASQRKIKNETAVLLPGTYCGGISVEANGHAVLSAGRYFLVGGGLAVASNASMSGTGVTIINTTRAGAPAIGPFAITAGAEIDLDADTTSTGLNGILFYQDPGAGAQPTASIHAGPTSIIRGTFYIPAATLDLSGGPDMTITGALVADKVIIGGNGNLTIESSTTATAGFYAPKRVTLVD